MEDDIDCILDRAQWEALKALGAPEPRRPALPPDAFERLAARDLVALQDGWPVITPRGRRRIVRGSERLWDPGA
ncbi:hypothetical protein [Enhydrobacter sp.]|jgi:hypothetical protein|uniref:hypothetical protein n=1 Tax=Enhydrobacter sp. TaxID=1894999 RepID=UPI00260B5171|nr:hypothetical protein [Enhydrobacter sp.]WIM09065.1 MAG: hypothetical protein OJF58_000016 [Enhydrobacter sp.]